MVTSLFCKKMIEIPTEIIFDILNFLTDAQDVIQFSKTCKHIFEIVGYFINTSYQMTPLLIKFCSSQHDLSLTINPTKLVIYYQINVDPLIIYSTSIRTLLGLGIHNRVASFINVYLQNDSLYFYKEGIIYYKHDFRINSGTSLMTPIKFMKSIP